MPKYIDTGHALTGALTGSDLRQVVRKSTLTMGEFHIEYLKNIISRATFDRWVLSTGTPSPMLLAHLTATYHELYVLSRLVLVINV